MEKIDKKVSIRCVLDSLSRNKILYEIKGDTAYFGYDSIGSSFFSDKCLKTRILNPDIDFLKVLRAVFFSFDIKTMNPSSICLKCKLNKSKKTIQIIDLDSTGSLLTRKFYLEFFDRFPDFDYGHFSVLKSPLGFDWKSQKEDLDFLENFFPDLDVSIDFLDKERKKLFFSFLEKCLVENKIIKREKLGIEDCRSYLVKNEIRNLRVFRKA